MWKNKNDAMRVLIAGIGGASLGTELLKCMLGINDYILFGCDISPFAFGHYMSGFKKTFVVDRHDYVNNILNVCRFNNVQAVVPGGEQPLMLLNSARERLAQEGVLLAANKPTCISTFTDKAATFKMLADKGFPVPQTKVPYLREEFDDFVYPCVIKPSTNSGGSVGVMVAESKEEALSYWQQATEKGKRVILQEYIPHVEGEFSLGVLSLPGKGVVGSIALKKLFESKFSVYASFGNAIISGPYSSGLIDDFLNIRMHVESIARSVDSQGPLNVQGRMRDGIFYVFEINPRFSGSEFVRTMAGFNQLDMYLKFVLRGEMPSPPVIRKGYYLRSLSEQYVPLGEIKS